MKKKLLSLALTAAMLMSLVPAAFAVSMPAATTKTYTLTDEYIASEIQGLKVTVTLDGYLGTLDMQEVGIEDEILAGLGLAPSYPGWEVYPTITEPRPIYVLKSGSDVKFTINNPAASYNYCFDPKMQPDEYGFCYDDSAGGRIYSYEFGELDGINTFINANGDGTATLTAGGIYSAQARKLSETSYAYTAKDGLYTFCFNAKNKADSADGVTWWPTDSVARYCLGTFLFISEEQVAEYEATGTMTFHKENYEFIGTYSHLYPGLAELLGGETPTKTLPDLRIYDQGAPGEHKPMGYTVTNNTGKHLTAHYALLSYWPVTSYYPPTAMTPEEHEVFHGQLLPIDVDLAPGESMTGECWSVAAGWSTMTHGWLTFESTEERDAFFDDDVLDFQFNSCYYIDNGQAGVQWMKDTFGFKIESGK